MKIMAKSGKSGTSNNPAGIPRTNSLGQDENNYTNYMKNIQKFGMSKTEWRMRGCPETQTSERNNTNYANWTHQEMNTTKPGDEKIWWIQALQPAWERNLPTHTNETGQRKLFREPALWTTTLPIPKKNDRFSNVKNNTKQSDQPQQ